MKKWVVLGVWVISVLFVSVGLLAQEPLVELVKEIRPAMVAVYTFNEFGESLMQGSGFFVNQRGDVITNWHVVEGAATAVVKTVDGRTHQVRGLWNYDREGDLALLGIELSGGEVRPLLISSRKPEQGQRVVVIGNPLALEFTVSDGIVAAIRHIPEYPVDRVIQITAPISSGSSGSPVVDMDGQVIAVAFYVYFNGSNLNFAIPAERVTRLLAGVGDQPAQFEDEITQIVFRVYRDDQLGFVLEYPMDWELWQDTYLGMEFTAFIAPLENMADPFRENLNILVESVEGTVSLEQYYAASLQALHEQPEEIEVIQTYDMMLDGLPARVLVYRSVVDMQTLTFVQVFAVRRQQGMVLTFTSESSQYPRYQGLYHEILSRFRFL